MTKTEIFLERWIQRCMRCAIELDKHHDNNQLIQGFDPHCVDYSDSGEFVLHSPSGALDPLFCSPELTQSNDDVDFRSSLYSLGVWCYTQLTHLAPIVTEDNAIQLIFSEKHPTVLQHMIQKLTHYYPEDRYQSLSGFLFDLQQCKHTVSEEGIPFFVPGSRDRPNQLCFGRFLYGREEDINTIRSCIVDSDSCSSFLFVSGYSGVGKTSVIQHTVQHFQKQSPATLYLKGKYSQSDTTPHMGLTYIFNQWVEQVRDMSVAEQERVLAPVKALSPLNSAVIVQLIPELGELLGPQSELPVLPPEKAEHRLARCLAGFFQALTQSYDQIVLFFDDIQWADYSSFKLLITMKQWVPKKLLVIGAYRIQESTQHLSLDTIIQFFHELQLDHNRSVSQLELSSLPHNAIQEQLQDLLYCDSEKAGPLTELVYQKTNGNPFFVQQLLQSIYDKQLLRFDAQVNEWNWDMSAIKKEPVADNVADLITDQLQRLPAATQELLQWGATLGQYFSKSEIQLLSSFDDISLEMNLRMAILNHCIIPVDIEEGVFAFLHDKIQHSAYHLSDLRTRQKRHRSVACSSLYVTDTDRVFQRANHFHQSQDILEEADKRSALMTYLVSLKRAKHQLAIEKSMEYSTWAQDTLNDIGGYPHISQYILMQRAHLLYLLGETDSAERLYLELLSKTESRKKKLRLYGQLAFLYTHIGYPEKTMALAADAWSLVGVEIPKRQKTHHMIWHAMLFRLLFFFRNSLPKPKKKYPFSIQDMQNLCSGFETAAYITDSYYMFYFIIKPSIFMLRQSIRRIDLSLMFIFLHRLKFESLPKTLLEIYYENVSAGVQKKTPKDSYLLGAYILPCFRPLKEANAELEIAGVSLMNYGEPVFASQALATHVINCFLKGESLEDLELLIARILPILRTNNEVLTVQATFFLDELSQVLLGKKPFDQNRIESFEGSLSELFLHIPAQVMMLSMAWYALLLDESEKAENWLQKLDGLTNPGFGLLNHYDYFFYRAIVTAAQFRDAALQSKDALRRIKSCEKQLKYNSALCPENFLHKLLFITAERYRIKKNYSKSNDLYRQSTDLALSNGFVAHAAMAAKNLSESYKEQGEAGDHDNYAQISAELFSQWGWRR